MMKLTDSAARSVRLALLHAVQLAGAELEARGEEDKHYVPSARAVGDELAEALSIVERALEKQKPGSGLRSGHDSPLR